MTVQVVLWGGRAGAQHYLLTGAIVSFLVYGGRYGRTAVVIASLYLVTVAGVIGKAKGAYDLWGDAVNVERRGTVEVKGRGAMATYWLEARLGSG